MTTMPRNPEVVHAEAVAALRARLEARGVEDAHELAAEYVAALIREGWRPRAARYEPPATEPVVRVPAERVPEYVAARAALRPPPIEEGTDRAHTEED